MEMQFFINYAFARSLAVVYYLFIFRSLSACR